MEADIKNNFANEWGTCQQWGPESRYAARHSISKVSALELIKSAEKIVKRIELDPSIKDVVLEATANPLIKLWGAEKEISIQHGEFNLFAVWHPVGTFGKVVDIVVCAPWVSAESRDGVSHVINGIKAALTPAEMCKIGGVIALDQKHPFVSYANEFWPNHHGQIIISDCMIGDFQIDFAMIITSMRPA